MQNKAFVHWDEIRRKYRLKSRPEGPGEAEPDALIALGFDYQGPPPWERLKRKDEACSDPYPAHR